MVRSSCGYPDGHRGASTPRTPHARRRWLLPTQPHNPVAGNALAPHPPSRRAMAAPYCSSCQAHQPQHKRKLLGPHICPIPHSSTLAREHTPPTGTGSVRLSLDQQRGTVTVKCHAPLQRGQGQGSLLLLRTHAWYTASRHVGQTLWCLTQRQHLACCLLAARYADEGPAEHTIGFTTTLLDQQRHAPRAAARARNVAPHIIERVRLGLGLGRHLVHLRRTTRPAAVAQRNPRRGAHTGKTCGTDKPRSPSP